MLISSGMGSIGEAESSHGWVYRASKAALNMAVKSASFDYPKATLVAMNPGWVKTDMGGPDAPLSPAQSVGAMRKVIAGLILAQSGKLFDYDGAALAW